MERERERGKICMISAAESLKLDTYKSRLLAFTFYFSPWFHCWPRELARAATVYVAVVISESAEVFDLVIV